MNTNSLTAEITYTGNLHTACKHTRSGQIFSTDAPTDNRGKGSAFSPTDLLGVSLGSCILTIMGIRCHDAGIDIQGARAEVAKTMLDNPRRIGKLEIRIFMPPGQYPPKTRKLIEAAAHGCPVSQSLHPDLEEIIEIIWP